MSKRTNGFVKEIQCCSNICSVNIETSQFCISLTFFQFKKTFRLTMVPMVNLVST